MTFALLSKMFKHLGFSFMVNVFGILYRIATAIASTFFVLILGRSILQFSGSTNIGAIRIIWKRKQRKPHDKIRFISSNNPRSLRFSAGSVRDHYSVIRRNRDISKSNLKSLRVGDESIITNQNNQQALSVSMGVCISSQALSVSMSVSIPSQALSVMTSVGTSLTIHHAYATVYLFLPCGFLGSQHLTFSNQTQIRLREVRGRTTQTTGL